MRGCNFLIPLPEEWYRWLGQWPRLLTWDIDRLVWAPAAFRAANVEQLEAAVSAAAWQLEMSAAQRLLRCGVPPAAPPHTPPHLEGDLQSYDKFWELAQPPQRLEEFFEKYVTRR